MRASCGGILLALALFSTPSAVGAAESIALHALFKDKAILVIDGARRVLKSGDTSPEGVRLIQTDTQREEAEVEVDGKRRVIRLGMIAGGFASQAKSSITLYPDSGGHFFADGLINGVAVRFMVDTGATTIAMNGATASRVGLDYKRSGRAGVAGTAAGMVRVYNLTLNSVQVGDVTLHNIEAGVIEGNYPTEVLLGMSFLGRFDMKREGEKLELIQRY